DDHRPAGGRHAVALAARPAVAGAGRHRRRAERRPAPARPARVRQLGVLSLAGADRHQLSRLRRAAGGQRPDPRRAGGCRVQQPAVRLSHPVGRRDVDALAEPAMARRPRAAAPQRRQGCDGCHRGAGGGVLGGPEPLLRRLAGSL
ncbi:MAG: putative membrane protein, partial [uncultured Nocardioidaceae bacterium]